MPMAALIVYQFHFGWPPLMIESIVVGLFAMFSVGPTWIAVMLLSAGARLAEFRWQRLHIFLTRILALVLAVVGGFLLLMAVMTGFPVWGVAVAQILLLSGVASLVASAVIVRYYYPSIYWRGLIDWVSPISATVNERVIRNQERFAMYHSRGKLLREKHGRFWWLRPRLRRWCAGDE